MVMRKAVAVLVSAGAFQSHSRGGPNDAAAAAVEAAPLARGGPNDDAGHGRGIHERRLDAFEWNRRHSKKKDRCKDYLANFDDISNQKRSCQKGCEDLAFADGDVLATCTRACKKYKKYVTGGKLTPRQAIKRACEKYDFKYVRCEATVYGGSNFDGWTATFPSGYYIHYYWDEYGAAQNEVSSVIVRGAPTGCAVTLYDHANYFYDDWCPHCFEVELTPGRYDAEALAAEGYLDDDLSAVLVDDGRCAYEYTSWSSWRYDSSGENWELGPCRPKK